MRLVVTHPGLRYGGSEATAMWSLQALRGCGSLELVTCDSVEFGRLNRQYGTDLQSDDINVRLCPVIGRLGHVPVGHALQGAVFQRWVHRVSRDADLVVSAYNISPSEAPALQLVADFSWDRVLRRRFAPVPDGIRGRFHNGMLGALYNGLADTLAGGDPDPARENYTILANSEWSAERMRERFGVKAPVLYPPVPADFPSVPWRERKKRFLALGRFSPAKRYDQLVRIVGRLQSRGHAVGLDIIAPVENESYAKLVRDVAEDVDADVRLLGGKFGEEKRAILPRYRYALHGRKGESFGIAVAELVKAGCVTFVPRTGGASEIVADERLTYRTVDEAVAKIGNVLQGPEQAKTLHTKMKKRGECFGADRFARELRDYAERVLRTA